MMKISHLVDDAIGLRFIPFALKDLAKKMASQFSCWFYHIMGWFRQDFLKKFYSIYKIALIKKNIM